MMLLLEEILVSADYHHYSFDLPGSRSSGRMPRRPAFPHVCRCTQSSPPYFRTTSMILSRAISFLPMSIFEIVSSLDRSALLWAKSGDTTLKHHLTNNRVRRSHLTVYLRHTKNDRRRSTAVEYPFINRYIIDEIGIGQDRSIHTEKMTTISSDEEDYVEAKFRCSHIINVLSNPSQ